MCAAILITGKRTRSTPVFDGRDAFREKLWPADAPNPAVWCARCRREHRQHTFTQADYDRMIYSGAQQLADAIDAKVADYVRRHVYG